MVKSIVNSFLPPLSDFTRVFFSGKSFMQWAPGISNQALVFMRDVKMFAERTDILAKSVILGNAPAEKWFGLRFVVPWDFLKNLFSTSWDSFHGGANPSYYFFFSVTDGQNANAGLITLSNDNDL